MDLFPLLDLQMSSLLVDFIIFYWLGFAKRMAGERLERRRKERACGTTSGARQD